MSKWKEIETPKGILKYRMPDISEGFDFLSSISKLETAQDVFKMKGTFASKMGSMIDYGSLDYESYADFLSDLDNNYVAFAKIADEVFIEITKALGKKPSSSTPSMQPPTVTVEKT